MKVEISGDENRVYDQLQFETVKREREQVQRVQAAENERLDVGDFQDYKRLRSELVISEPDLPLDEMSMSDYNKARDKETGGRR